MKTPASHPGILIRSNLRPRSRVLQNPTARLSADWPRGRVTANLRTMTALILSRSPFASLSAIAVVAAAVSRERREGLDFDAPSAQHRDGQQMLHPSRIPLLMTWALLTTGLGGCGS